ncbi:Beta-tubulin (Tubulin beta chain) [Durusdinium trenchii]|uniref:Beta-tubulin (Tubulin beta chain) n=1 Tax=Durusdinium trenchii TaxID=1381693 RepID=A0ABP0MW49_9DINO
MGMTVSHQSGNTSHTGRLIMAGAAKFGHLLTTFCLGSFFAGFSKADCELIYSGRYSPNMLAAAVAVVAGCMVHYCKEHAGDGNDNTSECLLLFAFSQGIQNGITRRCLSLPICTTHFTGYLTDVGTGFGAWARAVMNGENPPTLLKVLLFAAGILFFGLGGVAAKELHGPYNMQVTHEAVSFRFRFSLRPKRRGGRSPRRLCWSNVFKTPTRIFTSGRLFGRV